MPIKQSTKVTIHRIQARNLGLIFDSCLFLHTSHPGNYQVLLILLPKYLSDSSTYY